MQIPGDAIVESVPLVADGIMYTTGMPGQVFALDARTGRQIWKYERKQKVVNPYEINRVNRGVAILGNRLFFGTLDAALVALDRRTGALLWEVQVGDTMIGHSITSAPLALKDKIVTGISGGEFGIRGFIDAYDPATGKRLWRFNTIPGPGEFGHDTWEGDSWQHGGAPTWLTGSYDPGIEHALLDRRKPRPGRERRRAQGRQPVLPARWWRSIPKPESANGITSSPPTTPTIGMPPKTWSWWTACTRARCASCYCRPIAMACFMFSTGPSGQFLFATPFVRASWVKGWDENGRPITTPNWQSAPEGNDGLSFPGRRQQFPGALLQPADRLDVFRLSRWRRILRFRPGALRGGAPVLRSSGRPRRLPPAHGRYARHPGHGPRDREDPVEISSSLRIRCRPACWRRREAWSSPDRARAT